MYDIKCRDLALAFLEDHAVINTPDQASALAQCIQDAIEEHIEEAVRRHWEAVADDELVDVDLEVSE